MGFQQQVFWLVIVSSFLVVYGQENSTEVSNSTSFEDNSTVPFADYQCHLPRCYMNTGENPGNISTGNLPQIVLFAYTGSVTRETRDAVTEIFPDHRFNPNGCPISITLFVEGEELDGCSLHRLYVRGHEVATAGNNHSLATWEWVRANWTKHYQDHRTNLTRDAFLDAGHTQGARARDLIINEGLYAMEFLDHFRYDSSIIVQEPKHLEDIRSDIWPMTLDIPLAYQNISCLNSITGCPRLPHPGLWLLPVNPLVNSPYFPCTSLDKCRTNSPQDTFNILKNNFEEYYSHGRAPFQVNFGKDTLRDETLSGGLKKFLDYLQTKDDVWILTHEEALEWMRSPLSKDEGSGMSQCSVKRLYNTECSAYNNTMLMPPLAAVLSSGNLWWIQLIVLVISYPVIVTYDRFVQNQNKK